MKRRTKDDFMKEKLNQIILYLNLMGYNNSKIKLLRDMTHNQLDMENEALLNLLDTLVEDIDKKSKNKSILNQLEKYVEDIHEEIRLEEVEEE